MTDMNKSIGDTPIHKPVQAPFSKKEAEPAFGCAECAEEVVTPQTDLRNDPRDTQGRSLVAKRTISELKEMDPEIRAGIDNALEDIAFLEPLREALIERVVSTGKATQEKAEKIADATLLNVFGPKAS